MRLFGFEINRQQDIAPLPSFVAQSDDDGAVNLVAGGAYGLAMDLDGTIRSEAELINKYRQMAEQPEMDTAIDTVCNEAIIYEGDEQVVNINLDDVPVSDSIKKAIEEEFKFVLTLLEFNTHAYEIFRRWYVDGRVYFAVVLDPKDPNSGIQELRYIDPRKIRKIRETRRKKDPRTNIAIPDVSKEYYIYNEKGFYNSLQQSVVPTAGVNSGAGGVRIAKDAVVLSTSGISSIKGDMILSYLHKAIKPLNNLRALEDALIIYRISRAPERRIFYIDVGNLPKMKAEQYIRDVMVKFKNKVTYDATTGEIRDDRKFMTMLEDFWLPRREGGRGTEITTLPGGQNLSQIDDILYFQKNVYKSLNIPVTRLDSEAIFVSGQSGEITRDEVRFAKFIARVRMKFSDLFTQVLERQLVLKGVMTPEEFDQLIAEKVRYDYHQDNYYEELKEATIMNNRLAVLQIIDPYVGKYYSTTWVRKKILRQTDEDIEEIDEEITEDMRLGKTPLPGEQSDQ